MDEFNVSNIERKIDKLIELNTGTLETLKHMSDVNGLKITHLENEINELKIASAKSADSRKELYERVEQIRRRCSGVHGELDERRSTTDSEAGKLAKWAWGVLVGAVLGGAGMQIADKLF